MKKLSVLPRGAALVAAVDHLLGAFATGLREHRYIGRSFDPKHGIAGAWVPSSKPVSVPFVPESDPVYREAWQAYRADVQNGGLWAADAETAAACGVPFDPTFGGEFDEPPASKPSVHAQLAD